MTLACFATTVLAVTSTAAHQVGGLRLLDDELTPPLTASTPGGLVAPAPYVPVLLAASEGARESADANPDGQKPPERPRPGDRAATPSLDFDLLGAPAKTKAVDDEALRKRRKILGWHQGVGLGMFTLQLATTVVGQLNYSDKFGGDNTGKYVQPHAILAYSTLAAFAVAGTLALLAPKPFERDEGFDRVSLHKLSMAIATAGMVAQGVLGIWTQSREGYLNQQSIGTVHLVLGYVTLAAVATGAGALVF